MKDGLYTCTGANPTWATEVPIVGADATNTGTVNDPVYALNVSIRGYGVCIAQEVEPFSSETAGAGLDGRGERCHLRPRLFRPRGAAGKSLPQQQTEPMQAEFKALKSKPADAAQ